MNENEIEEYILAQNKKINQIFNEEKAIQDKIDTLNKSLMMYKILKDEIETTKQFILDINNEEDSEGEETKIEEEINKDNKKWGAKELRIFILNTRETLEKLFLEKTILTERRLDAEKDLKEISEEFSKENLVGIDMQDIVVSDVVVEEGKEKKVKKVKREELDYTLSEDEDSFGF
eukprot:TRINITY_DN15982_c0_g1_i1.p1 TRINITY_DN15982_c0_g1~~TRINITY_DN15982_c0_g1_i1.p1  ORF type:complete len:196 (+),score=82.94 TRINITY_DN15982_c0_g1_i1:63-590(+)